MKETLSDNIQWGQDGNLDFINIKDIREFISDLKEEFGRMYGSHIINNFEKVLDKLAGKELINYSPQLNSVENTPNKDTSLEDKAHQICVNCGLTESAHLPITKEDEERGYFNKGSCKKFKPQKGCGLNMGVYGVHGELICGEDKVLCLDCEVGK